jgi:acyl CoA:acetate/3-ketoacid CoA transferase alpha subunit
VKTMRMLRTFNYRPRDGVIIVYEGGYEYRRVPEAAVRKIIQDGAGEIVKAND